MPERRTAVAVAALLLSGLLSACSGDDPPPTPHGEAAEPWNPCDGLSAAAVEAAFDTPFTLDDGEEGDLRCLITPTEEGAPAMEANYQVFPAGLEAVFEGMGPVAGKVVKVDVPGADDARLVINPQKGTLLISAFVQNGDLIQTLQLVDPEPFDRAADVRGVRRILAAFSAHAEAEDAG